MPASGPAPAPSTSARELARVVGVPGAVLMGLGSILGTGIFVSIGVAAGIAGSAAVLAVAVAAAVATCNGLSSAQLAASHPVSGGTYEYGYRYLNPPLGFTAGWMFLCAKSASAATAALGSAGYALTALGVAQGPLRTALAVAVVLTMTVVVAGGMRRSNRTNAVIVTLTLMALSSFVVAGAPHAAKEPLRIAESAATSSLPSLLHATAFLFVAYTGYGRVATLGEEIRDPARNIPRAILLTLVATLVIYVPVTWVALGALGASGLAQATDAAAAPLEIAARTFEVPLVSWLVTLGAVTAMLGVLLNLLLGLSRVLLAMARRRDMPAAFAKLSGTHASPRRAVIAVGVFVAGLTLLGDVAVTWSFSAFTVLVYYSLTNWAALRLPKSSRRYPRWIALLGLVSCIGLAFWVEPAIWLTGLGLILAGLLGRSVARRLTGRRDALDERAE